jgi:hypothetical protein
MVSKRGPVSGWGCRATSPTEDGFAEVDEQLLPRVAAPLNLRAIRIH